MLNREQIKEFIEKEKLIEDFIDLDVQLAPNGFDLTIEKIFKFVSAGTLDFSNSERIVSEVEEIFPKQRVPEDKYGWWKLESGVYKVKTNEILNLPKNLIGMAFSRSSLLRMGCFIETGVWDAGFSGKSEFILMVSNHNGIYLKHNARVAQLLFVEITETKEGYNGIYKNLQ